MYAKLPNSITKLVKFQDPHHSPLLVPLRFGVLKYCVLESSISCVWWLGAAFDTAGVYNNQQLPQKHIFTNLIFEYYHSINAHIGPHHALSLSWEEFWIVNGLSSLSTRLLECHRCRKWKSAVGKFFMSDLPDFRVALYQKTWSAIDVDLCGPFEVKVGYRGCAKRYIC